MTEKKILVDLLNYMFDNKVEPWNNQTNLKTVDDYLASNSYLSLQLVISDEINTEWLMEKHPELYVKEAVALREFCFNHSTIRLKECYGDGSIMYWKWKDSLKQN